MRVHTNISDLFFNTVHEADLDKHGDFIGYASLEEEATDFLSSLENLGVAVPRVEELIEDFNNRI